MTDPGYNLVEIVDAVRRAGNPQKAALEALADTDAVLLDALGVEQWGDLPTLPYPDAPAKAPDTAPPIRADKADKPRKKPGPKPGSRRRAAPAPEAVGQPEPQEAEGGAAQSWRHAAKLKDELSEGWDGLTQFIMAWEAYLPADLMDMVKQAGDTAAAFLDGMTLMEKTLVSAHPVAPGGDKEHF